MSLFKTCRSCATPSVDAEYREQHYMVLCAACNADLNSVDEADEDDTPETRVVFPESTGVLTYQPFRTKGGQGGGR